MKVVFHFLAALALVVLVGVPQAFAQNPIGHGPPCSLDRLAGEWGFVNIGKIGSVDVNGTGTFHLNNDGTSSSHLFANKGNSYVDFERFGITTINDDCMLTQTWNDGGPAAHCVVVDDGNEIWCIYEQTPASQVTLKRIHTRN